MRSRSAGRVIQFHQILQALLSRFSNYAHVAAHLIYPSSRWMNADFIAKADSLFQLNLRRSWRFFVSRARNVNGEKNDASDKAPIFLCN
jgi:hypothetical protein